MTDSLVFEDDETRKSREKKERKAAYQREYKKRPGAAERDRLASQKYRDRHPDRIKEIRARHSDKQREFAREWRKDNPEYLAKHAERQRERRARTKAAGIFTSHHARLAAAFWGNCCAYCGAPVNVTRRTGLDHVVPLIHGGRNEPSNVVPCCKHCNNEKNQTLPSGPNFERLLIQLDTFVGWLPSEANRNVKGTLPLEVIEVVGLAECFIRGKGVPVGRVW